MAPSFMIDNDSDFNHQPSLTKMNAFSTRTLLLAPPSIASHEENLRAVLSAHDRSVTDLQMLDRISAGFVALPRSAYDLILILTDVDGMQNESSQLLGREVLSKIVPSLKPGGKLQSQDGSFGQNRSSPEYTEAVLAGLVAKGKDGMVKPDYSASEAIPLRFGRKKEKAPDSSPVSTVSPALKRKSIDMSTANPAGVGFVDLSDDFNDPIITGEDNYTDDDDDDELIDEDTLLTAEDLARPVQIRNRAPPPPLFPGTHISDQANHSTAPACIPRVGKRRRACKDCTCGLAEKLAAEDATKRSTADAQLRTLKLGADDLVEVDFTVQGKVGSCGNCSLGDAFRCEGCPYIGMPAFFKPGEEVRLLNNDVQL